MVVASVSNAARVDVRQAPGAHFEETGQFDAGGRLIITAEGPRIVLPRVDSNVAGVTSADLVICRNQTNRRLTKAKAPIPSPSRDNDDEASGTTLGG